MALRGFNKRVTWDGDSIPSLLGDGPGKEALEKKHARIWKKFEDQLDAEAKAIRVEVKNHRESLFESQ
jgi:hypothetical protein